MVNNKFLDKRKIPWVNYFAMNFQIMERKELVFYGAISTMEVWAKLFLAICLLKYTDQEITLNLVWIIVSPCKIISVISLDQDLEMTHT